MHKKIRFIFTLLISTLIFQSPVKASFKPTWWGASAGQINVFRENQFKNNFYGLEVRFTPITQWSLTPSLGYQWSDSGISYFYSGLSYDIDLSDRWTFDVHSGVGLYDDGQFLNLGHTVQFRSGIEFDYQLTPKQKLGIVINHFSNSRLSAVNPGTESVSLIYLNKF
ncbi:acyloxyacyl hydrolase [Marinicella sp. S1101]|uniref:acyloxyacyl hydrolase n=1 Tax=Marinicella marina TaxID=2996016 RepID=UPI002260C17C|nr:acyloxyacyl hydrolase [Marinicella marina]MCX7553590.1 acyloxyacyl hydrolase [Marinicella marina]MDJ1140214.1 acyloxyacyl hydrolase [Marinicella marina]